MAERRPLIDGLKPPHQAPAVDPQLEREFVHGKKIAAVPPTAPPAAMHNINRALISTRVRADLFAAVKRASLQRQLEGVSPNTLQDILDLALESWLNSNGYLG